MTVFACRNCGAPVTRDVSELAVAAGPGGAAAAEPGVATVPRRHYLPVPPTGAPETRCGGDAEGVLVLHPEDGSRLRRHPEAVRSSGCCGPSGVDGPNLVCRCGAEIATLSADCWTPHELRVSAARVRPVGGGTRRG